MKPTKIFAEVLEQTREVAAEELKIQIAELRARMEVDRKAFDKLMSSCTCPIDTAINIAIPETPREWYVAYYTCSICLTNHCVTNINTIKQLKEKQNG